MKQCAMCITAGVLLATGLFAKADSITLQDGTAPAPGRPTYWGTTDSWLNAGIETRNYGGSPALQLTWDDGYEDNIVVKFDLSGQIPANQRILSASLSFWYALEESLQSDNAVTIKPYRIRSGYGWYENIYNGESGYGVNYRYRDDGQTQQWTGQTGGWDDKIDDGNGTNRIKETGGSVVGPVEPQHWVSFSVTNSLSQWYGGAANNGFALFATGFEGGGSYGGGVFGARNDSLSTYRPKLTITYEGALAPIAQANGPYTCPYLGSVQLSATGSNDPDGGDIVAYAWELTGNGQYDDASGVCPILTYAYLTETLGLAAGEHTVCLRVTDDEGEFGYDTATLNILPEPATVGLLALGSLLAIRRRRRRL